MFIFHKKGLLPLTPKNAYFFSSLLEKPYCKQMFSAFSALRQFIEAEDTSV